MSEEGKESQTPEHDPVSNGFAAGVMALGMALLLLLLERGLGGGWRSLWSFSSTLLLLWVGLLPFVVIDSGEGKQYPRLLGIGAACGAAIGLVYGVVFRSLLPGVFFGACIGNFVGLLLHLRGYRADALWSPSGLQTGGAVAAAVLACHLVGVMKPTKLIRAEPGKVETAREEASQRLTSDYFPFRDEARVEYEISGALDMTQEWLYLIKDGTPYIIPQAVIERERTVRQTLPRITYQLEGQDIVLTKENKPDRIIKGNAEVGDKWSSGFNTYEFIGFEDFAYKGYKGDPSSINCAVVQFTTIADGQLITSGKIFYAKNVGMVGKVIYGKDGQLLGKWTAVKVMPGVSTKYERRFWGEE